MEEKKNAHRRQETLHVQLQASESELLEMVKLLKKVQQCRICLFGPKEFFVFWFVLFFFFCCQTLIINVCDEKKTWRKKQAKLYMPLCLLDKYL
jgi:hypothetical protein